MQNSKCKIKYGESGEDGPQAAHKRCISGACGAVTAFYARGAEIIAKALAKSLPMWYNKRVRTPPGAVSFPALLILHFAF